MSKRNISEVYIKSEPAERGTFKSARGAVIKSSGKSVRKAVTAKGSFAAKVKKVIESAAEKKQKDSWISFGAFGGGANHYPVIELTPNASTLTISQGAGVDQRIGNRVKIHKATFRGYIAPNGYDVTTNPTPQPCLVKMYFYMDKLNPQSATDPSGGGNGFYRLSGTPSDMNGAQFDAFKEINTERYTLYGTRTFKVGWASSADQTAAVGAFGGYINNDSNQCARFEIDVAKWMPKHIVWNDTSVTPTTRALLCCVEATGITSTSNNFPVSLCGAIHLSYTDE